MSALPDQFQDDVVYRLSDAYFDDIVVIQERKGTAATDAAKAYQGEISKGGKFGAFLIVELPEMLPIENVRGQSKLRITVQIRTIPKFNDLSTGTQKQSGELYVAVDQRLHLFTRGNGVWRAGKVVPYSDQAGTVGYDYPIEWDSGVPNAVWCATPKITVADGNVTLTSPDDGVAIYYTTDDSFPIATNSAATLYTIPFAVVPGNYVCAAAYHADLLGSGIQRLKI
ncbi:MAG: FN3 associated domain-containing protein [Chthoniobacter sp.]|nr:FN3 associated domain-containing protein [Chthoniobacter sp.]